MAAGDQGVPNHRYLHRCRLPRAQLNWDVVLRIRAALTALGVRTAMSRGNDNALGPCVDQRAAMANALQPDAIVSIHADSGPPDGQGFHVNYSSPPLNAAQAGPAVRFAQVMRDQLVSAGLQPSTYRGTHGLYGRADLAGLNLARYPSTPPRPRFCPALRGGRGTHQRPPRVLRRTWVPPPRQMKPIAPEGFENRWRVSSHTSHP